MRSLWCALGFHKLNSECHCCHCGIISHKYSTEKKWVAESGIDTGPADGGVWLRYDEAQYKVTTCKRCGKVYEREGPIRFRGKNP